MEMASRLQTCTLAGEELYRLNGDEFAFVTRGDAGVVKERIRCLLEQTRLPVVLNRQVFILGATAGAAHAPVHGDDPELLLQRACLSLSHGKRVSRDDVVVYEQSLEVSTRLRTELEAELRVAVETGQFTLLLQPKGSLAGRRVIGAEALIRWQHPTRGMLAPDQFLPLARGMRLDAGHRPLGSQASLDADPGTETKRTGRAGRHQSVGRLAVRRGLGR